MGAVRHIDDAERRARLVLRHHVGHPAADAETAVSDLVVMHSTDPATPYLGVRARVAGVNLDDIDRSLYVDRTLWRLHAMRRTLWIATLADAPVVMAGAARAVADKERRRVERFVEASGIDAAPAFLADLEGRILAALDVAGTPMSTTALNDRVEGMRTPVLLGSGKWAQEQPVGPRLLYVMAMEGTIVRTAPAGSWRASQYAWMPTSAWFGARPGSAVALDEATGRTALADRYLDRFGPVTTDDVKWWTGWTVRQTRAALADAGAVAVTVTVDGTSVDAWVAPGDEPPGDVPSGVVTLLPALDPTPMGWKDRGWYLGEHGAFGGPLFDRNGNVGPTIWFDGRVVGGWAQRADGQVVTRLLADIGHHGSDAVAVEAERLTTWLRGHVVIPRFRTPMEKEMALG